MNHCGVIFIVALLPYCRDNSYANVYEEAPDRLGEAISSMNQSIHGSITGDVRDADSHDGLFGGKVEVLGTDKSAMTGVKGRYKITSLADGVYQVRVNLSGYVSVIKNDIQVQSGSDESVRFLLKRSADNPPDFVAVEKVPLPTLTPSARNPKSAKKEGVEGLVWVKVVVDEQGRAGRTAFLQLSLTHRGLKIKAHSLYELSRLNVSLPTQRAVIALVEATLAAVKRWRFEPALWEDKPIKVWYTIPFKYRVSSDSSTMEWPKKPKWLSKSVQK